MKVVHINEHLARKGGVETYLLALLPLLEARGVESRVVYGSGDPAEYARSTRVSGIGRASFRGQAAVREEMRAVLEAERPDVVHLHNVQNVGAVQACLDYGATVMTAHDYRFACPASSYFHKRTQEVCTRQCGPGCFAVTLRGHCLTPRPQYASYFYYRTRWALGRAGRYARVVAPSTDARERLTRAGFPEDRISVLPYFCPVEPAADPRPLPARPTITYMGRIAPNKGYEFFIQALGLLPPEVQGIMVGNLSGDAGRIVREIARKAGCEDRLVLRPWASRAEVLEVLDQTTVFVFPSLWPETLGIVGLEALARGVPVVGSDLGGVRDWLLHRENGLLVAPKRPDEIRDAVSELLTDERQLLAFGRRGIETVRERFLSSTHVHELVRLYHRAAAER